MIEVAVRSAAAEIDLIELTQWLSAERELAGRVKPVRGVIGDQQLGGAFEMISIAVGSGGAVSVLLSSLNTWLQNRPKTTIKVTRGDTTIEIDAGNLKNVPELMDKLLKGMDDKRES